MKEVPCDEILASYTGGLSERRCQSRTVESLDADRIRAGLGNETARTYVVLSLECFQGKGVEAKRCIHHPRALRARQRVYMRSCLPAQLLRVKRLGSPCGEIIPW